MKRPLASLVAALAVAGLLVLGCSQAAPAPTSAPAAPKAAEPTKAAAPAAPTAAPAAPTKAPEPAKKVDWPQKGKAVTMIVNFPPGGNSDIGIRILSPLLEKELGVPVEVVNRAGAAGQVGVTELHRARPDGYTMGLMTFPATITFYLDPGRQAPFLKELIPLGMQNLDPYVFGVPTNSPYKDVKDVVDAAKANPGKIRAGPSGIQSPGDFAVRLLQKVAGVRFSIVNFDGSAPAITAMLGGHVDFAVQPIASFTPQLKSGDARMIGLADKEESSFLPGVKTLEAQGYKVSMSTAGTIAAPPGTPVEVQKIVEAALKKAITSEEHMRKTKEALINVRYMDMAQIRAFWQEMESQVKPLMEEAAQEQQKK